MTFGSCVYDSAFLVLHFLHLWLAIFVLSFSSKLHHPNESVMVMKISNVKHKSAGANCRNQSKQW